MGMRVVTCAALAAVVVFGNAVAGDLKSDIRTVALEGAKRLEISCIFGAGHLRIEPGTIADAAKIDAEYDPDQVELDVAYKVRGESGVLRIETDHSGRHIDTDDNSLDLVLSDKLPTDLRLKLGACKSDVELGGIPLTALNLEVGAMSGAVSFSKPNPSRMRRMTVEIGASSARLYQIGNANAERIKCDVGAASSHLDFTGEYKGETEVDVTVGVASAEIVLPSNVPVRVESDDNGWFSSVKFRKRDLKEVEDNVWESPDFETAANRLVIRIEVGMGSVKVMWE